MKDVTLKINGNQITVPRGTSIYMAAAKAGISIPSLCRHEDLEPKGACGMCIVQIQGQPGFKRSCVTPVEEGMEVFTTTAAIRDIRRGILELVLAAHVSSTVNVNFKLLPNGLKYAPCVTTDTPVIFPLMPVPSELYGT
jgi:predicted molibdopterin-dependent oxidoreductase YjgC